MAKTEQPFHDCLRQALDQYHEPHKLSGASPLASVYFLGESVREQQYSSRPKDRGDILREKLYEAAVTMWGELLPDSCDVLEAKARDVMGKHGTNHPIYFFWILELRYFRHYYMPDEYPTGNLHKYVGVGKGSFFEHLKRAIAALSWRFLKESQPTYRLESPISKIQLVGRYALKQKIIEQLQEKRTVALCGAGGLGKTSLGVAVQQAWDGNRHFWYTIRPQINDNLDAILFSLGHFLNLHGASQLWMQLLATADIDYALALGLLHDDLKRIRNKKLLLCFDEVGLIHPLHSEQVTEEQTRIIEFLDGLRSVVPLLLIGQSIPLDVDTIHQLEGLTVEDSQKLLKQMGNRIEEIYIKKIWTLTSGNPRLLILISALLQGGATVAEIEDLSKQNAGIAAWWRRLRRHLSGDELSLIKQMAVFETASPKDVWQTDDNVLETLKTRRLVQEDAAGGVTLLPFIREQLLHEMTQEALDDAHYHAAFVWGKRGEFTYAAHHLQQAGRERESVDLWWTYRELEIDRGRTQMARQIFNRISVKRLTGTYSKQLKVIKAQLNLMAGEVEPVLGLPVEKSDDPIDLDAKFYELYGEAHYMSGNLEKALTFYDQSLATYAQLTREMVSVRERKANARLWNGEVDQAHQEALQAEHTAAYLRGNVDIQRGNLPEAYQSLNNALRYATLLDNTRLLAHTHDLLTIVLGRSGRLEEANYHADLAATYFGNLGDVRRKWIVRSRWGAACMDSQKYEEAISVFEEVFPFYRSVNDQLNIASMLCNLAECYFKVGKLEKARQMALDVLKMEFPYQQPYACYTLGLVYGEMDEVENVIVTFKRGIEQAKRNEDNWILAYLLQGLGEVLVTNSRINEALHYLEQSLALFEQMKIESEVDKIKQILTN